MMTGLAPTGSAGRKNAFVQVALLATTMLTTAFQAQAHAQQAQAAAQSQEAAADNDALSDIVVTAQKRAENLQSVPASIQAFGTERLDQLQVSSFNDYAKFLPSVAYQSYGPGLANVYMRGITSGGDGRPAGPQPSVGTYLNEQPITTIGGALDIHVYDVARVESLAGPQGTLYGSSSQAGTIRIITNKPDPKEFSASYDLSVDQVDHGGLGYTGEAYANVPLSEAAAIRIVGWYDRDAGYIDNVPGTLTYPTSGVTLDNSAIAKKNYNSVDTYGGRMALGIDLSDDWTVTPTVMAQDQKSRGFFGYNPKAGDLAVSHFLPERSHDRWYQASLTIEGKVSDFDVVYAGAYLKRNVDSLGDYTDFSFFYDQLYQNGAYITDASGTPIDPSEIVSNRSKYTKQSHELRVSTPKDNRLKFVGGLFYQRSTHDFKQQFVIRGLDPALSVSGLPETYWLTDQRRIDSDKAIFGELTFDITSRLSLTGGLRVFKTKSSLLGFFGFGEGTGYSTGEASCFAGAAYDVSPCTNVDASTSQSGTTHKVNLTWKIDDDRLVYATVSRGFRPGGINRRPTVPAYKADYLDNYEIGWKTSWFGDTLRFNGDIFYLVWKDVQFSVLGENAATEIRNAGKADVRGAEADITWRPMTGLTLSASGAYTDAKLAKPYCGTIDNTCNVPLAPKGQALPVTPKFKGNVVARYQFPLGDLEAHVQGSAVYQGASWADLRTVERNILGRQKAYGSFDFAAGIARGNWSLEASIINLFDVRGQNFRYGNCTPQICGATAYILPSRPRTFGLKFGQKF